VQETVAGVTTSYLVADQNLTGYAQVMDELQGGAVTRTYTYGLSLISESQTLAAAPVTSFYGFDGHGSVRYLTSSTGAVTDTYDYDAFGNLISSTGSTPNSYLFAGEQFDPALGIYYNRAKYYDQRIGRFWTMDMWEGDPGSPASLHKYLYTGGNPVDRVDPNGNDWDLPSLSTSLTTIGTLASSALIAFQNVATSIYFNLYRVPQIIDQASTALLYLAGSLEIGIGATNAIEDVARNLQNSTITFSASPSQMGSEMENVAGVNLQRNTQSYDSYYPDTESVIQLKGTRQTSSPQALMGVVRGAVNDLNTAPERVDSFFRTGQPVTVIRSNLKVRAAVIAIPDTPVSWDFRAFLAQVEQLEEAEQVIVKIVPTAGLK
jgi:RHS repeat-associated protein